MRTALEFLIATAILGMPVYGSWAYYILTGHALRFG